MDNKEKIGFDPESLEKLNIKLDKIMSFLCYEQRERADSNIRNIFWEYIQRTGSIYNEGKKNFEGEGDILALASKVVGSWNYRTYVLETPLGSSDLRNRTVLIVSPGPGNNALMTFNDIEDEFHKLEKSRFSWILGSNPNESLIPNIYEFMAAFQFHILNRLMHPGNRKNYGYSYYAPFIYKRIAALYIFGQMDDEYKKQMIPPPPYRWLLLANAFGAGINCMNYFLYINNTCQRGDNQNLLLGAPLWDSPSYGAPLLDSPSYYEHLSLDKFIGEKLRSTHEEDESIKKLLFALFGEDIEAVQKFLWFMGRVFIGKVTLEALKCSREKIASMTEIHCGQAGVIRSLLIELLKMSAKPLDDNLDNLKSKGMWCDPLNITQCWPSHDSIFWVGFEDTLAGNRQTPKLSESMIPELARLQFNGFLVNIAADPKIAGTKTEFIHNLFNEESVQMPDAYKKTLSKQMNNSEYETYTYMIPYGLNYRSSMQYVVMGDTTNSDNVISKLSQAKRDDNTYIDIHENDDAIRSFIQEKKITPEISARLVMLSIIYTLNKVILGYDALAGIDTAAKHKDDSLTERGYLKKFMEEFLTDETDTLDIADEDFADYDSINWGNTYKAVTGFQEAHGIDKMNVTAVNDILNAYLSWRKKVAPKDDKKWTAKDFEEMLFPNLKAYGKYADYMKVLLCRKTMDIFYDTEGNLLEEPERKQVTGIYGIKADFSKIKEAVEIAGEKKAQKAKENRFNAAIDRLFKDLDNALNSVEKFKILLRPSSNH